METNWVQQEQIGDVCTLTLNRPAALNSFNQALHQQLRAALDQAAQNATVRCVILTGSGRAFCAGQDLKDPRLSVAPGEPLADLGAAIEQDYRPLVMRIRSMPVPVIAAVNGVAVGAGANVALACDLVIAAQSASFIQAFSKIGLLPDCGGTWLLPHLVGRCRALGLAWLGDTLSAAEAERLGLIWQCVEDSRLSAAALTLAQRLAALPLKALIATRQAMDQAGQSDLDSALMMEAKLQRELGWTHDFQEGVAAFLEKRPPHFTDR